MTKTTVSLALAASLMLGAAGAHAQGAPDPTAARGGAYKVEPNHTQVGFSVLHLGFTKYDGVFSGASGSLTLDPQSLAATALDVTVPVASVATTNAKLDGELRAPDWLDADKYPTMRFHSTRITRTGADSATVDGELTLHGVTRPVAFNARFIGAGSNPLDHAYTVGFLVSGAIHRSDFGVTKYVPLVSDTVDLTINAAFEKAN